ncbi:uncharacterized protein LOC110901340 [Helianthus annuus]|uniref:uncharacterized protein LOC110901340 n=1 Tax=Helianthus annuus TaxID=4232 RepID=UPI000B8F7EE0|nr:uncharacterized protein LOC110901340 [Helianthus annuus]
MHIEKNVCDSLLGLLLDIPGKTKDGVNARKDKEEMGIRKELAPVEKGNRIYLPPACYTMSKEEKKKFCKCLHDIKVPSCYFANIKRLVSMKDCKLLGMKSHDCHVLMTHMIPIAVRGLLPEKKYFMPSFFDVMVHLVIHIVEEINACGPLQKTPKVAYFNIHKITGKECEENFASVKEHLLGVYKLKKGTKYFLAPFFYRAHWVLFIVSPKERSVWILDTISVKANKDKDDYPLSRAIESSFGSGLTWTMVQCKQQDGSWECGFMVIWFMVQFVLKKRFRFPNNIWTETTSVTQEKIDMLVENIMTRFFKSKSVGWLNAP